MNGDAATLCLALPYLYDNVKPVIPGTGPAFVISPADQASTDLATEWTGLGLGKKIFFALFGVI